MKAGFVTLGCKLNYAETSTWERALVQHGWEVVPWSSTEADFYIVNTCSVTEHSDKKSRNIVRKLHRSCPGARIIVAGCSAQLRREELQAIEGVDRVFGATEKSAVVPYMLGKAAGAQEDYFPAFSSGERTRSFLKVQDGCDFKCNYCTVPYARGSSRNPSIASVVQQAREIASLGIKEVVLTGVNTGDFGRSTGENFLQLIRALGEVDGIERWRISSIEPNLLTEEIVDWIACDSKFQPHFHIPLQSGCDKVLREMGRRYLTDDFASKIDYIRNAMEAEGKQKVFFGIDVIAGFPGESEDDFRATYDFLEQRVRPSFIHVFPYSRRPLTPAAQREDQVQDSVKTLRVQALEQLSDRLHKDFLQSNAGLRSKVLFETRCLKDEEGRCGDFACGWSANYIRVFAPWEEGIINQIREVTL